MTRLPLRSLFTARRLRRDYERAQRIARGQTNERPTRRMEAVR